MSVHSSLSYPWQRILTHRGNSLHRTPTKAVKRLTLYLIHDDAINRVRSDTEDDHSFTMRLQVAHNIYVNTRWSKVKGSDAPDPRIFCFHVAVNATHYRRVTILKPETLRRCTCDGLPQVPPWVVTLKNMEPFYNGKVRKK